MRINSSKLLRAVSEAHISFALIASLFGLLFIFTTPLLWGQDEITHFGRAYQVSRGHMLPKSIQTGAGTNYGGTVPRSAYNLLSQVTNDLSQGNLESQKNNGVGWVKSTAIASKLGNESIRGEKTFLLFPNTAPYSPISYLPSAAGLGTAQIINSTLASAIHLARLFSLIFYIAVLYFVLKALRNLRAKWLIFAVALLPTSVYQASMITADTVTLAAIITVSGLYLKTLLKQRLTKFETVLFLGGIVLLPLLKPTYVLFSLLLLLVPVRLLGFSGSSPKIRHSFKLLLVTLSFILLLGWSYLTKALVDAPKLALPHFWAKDIDSTAQLHYMLRHPFTTGAVFLRTTILQDTYLLNGTVGQFGYSNILAPGLAVIASFFAMLISTLNMERLNIGYRKILWQSGILFGSIAVLFATFYMTITPVGGVDGPISKVVQGLLGRYFVPYLVLAFITAGSLYKYRIEDGKSASKSTMVAVVSLVIFSLVVSYLKYVYILWG